MTKKKPVKKSLPAKSKAKAKSKTLEDSVLDDAKDGVKDEIRMMRAEEIEMMKKEIIRSITDTITPLLEALQKIKDEHAGRAPSDNTGFPGGQMQTLEDMQKAALETMNNSNEMLKKIKLPKSRRAMMIQNFTKKNRD